MKLRFLFILLAFASFSSAQVTTVATFGAKGDGITDNCKALTAAVAYLQAGTGRILVVPPGQYLHSCTLTFAGVSHASIMGPELETSAFVYTGSGTTGYDFTGASYILVQRLGLEANNATAPPKSVIVLARNSSLLGDAIDLEHVTVYGYATGAVAYIIAQDGYAATDSYFRLLASPGSVARYTVYVSQNDDLGFGGGITSSTSLVEAFTRCDIINDGTTPGDALHIRAGGSLTVAVRDSYIYANMSHGIGLDTALTGTALGPIVIEDDLIEHAAGSSGDAIHVYYTGGGVIGNLRVTNNRDSNPTSGYFLRAEDLTNLLDLHMSGNVGAGGITAYAVTSSRIVDGQYGPWLIRDHFDQSYLENTNPNRNISAPYQTCVKNSTWIDNGTFNVCGKLASFSGGAASAAVCWMADGKGIGHCTSAWSGTPPTCTCSF